MSIAEKIGALTHAIEVMTRESIKGGMEGIAARNTAKILTAIRDALVEKMNGQETLVELQSKVIAELVELFVDTTTVENPEQERVVIEARALKQ